MRDNRMISSIRTKGACAVAASIQGLSHAKRQEPMQDWHILRELEDGWVLAVVCDGVGSEKYADIGAKTAAESFSEFIVRFGGFFKDRGSILDLMKTACMHAVGKLEAIAEKNAHAVHEYSTTLHAAIFANGIIYYAHAGDGTIIAMTDEGNMILLTEPQKGADETSVIPLLAGPENWQFGSAAMSAQSILLCTDGVGDQIAGTVLRQEACKLDRPLAAYFLSPWAFDYKGNLNDIACEMADAFDGTNPEQFYHRIILAIAQGQSERKATQFVGEIYEKGVRLPARVLQGIQDDITVAVVQKAGCFPDEQPMEWYQPPDWETINRRIYKILYEGG